MKEARKILSDLTLTLVTEKIRKTKTKYGDEYLALLNSQHTLLKERDVSATTVYNTPTTRFKVIAGLTFAQSVLEPPNIPCTTQRFIDHSTTITIDSLVPQYHHVAKDTTDKNHGSSEMNMKFEPDGI